MLGQAACAGTARLGGPRSSVLPAATPARADADARCSSGSAALAFDAAKASSFAEQPPAGDLAGSRTASPVQVRLTSHARRPGPRRHDGDPGRVLDARWPDVGRAAAGARHRRAQLAVRRGGGAALRPHRHVQLLGYTIELGGQVPVPYVGNLQLWRRHPPFDPDRAPRLRSATTAQVSGITNPNLALLSTNLLSSIIGSITRISRRGLRAASPGRDDDDVLVEHDVKVDSATVTSASATTPVAGAVGPTCRADARGRRHPVEIQRYVARRSRSRSR